MYTKPQSSVYTIDSPATLVLREGRRRVAIYRRMREPIPLQYIISGHTPLSSGN